MMRHTERVTYRLALEAVLLFHEGGEWDASRRAAWTLLTGQEEATTKGLCNTVRAALAQEGEFGPRPPERS